MTSYEMLMQINCKTKTNIEELDACGKMESISKCMKFIDDLQVWASICDSFADEPLVKEALVKICNSIIFCAQGCYKLSISTLRQSLEHILFAILLSTNDYNHKLWENGQYDMSWAKIMEESDGVFGKRFIRMYAQDLEESRSLELIVLSKNVYRECSELIHGNFKMLSTLPTEIEFDERAFDYYFDMFSSVQYLICMSLFIRFRYVLNKTENLLKLEQIVMNYVGTLQEVQLLFDKETEIG